MPGREPASLLIDTHPELALEAVQVASGVPLPTLGTHSNQTVRWRCSTCGHLWEAKVAARTKGGGCPVCAQAKRARSRAQAPPGASLQDCYPTIAAEFVRNVTRPDMTPADLRARAQQLCVWQCAQCGHQWQSTVANRTYGRGCTACANRRRADARRRPTATTNTAAERAAFPLHELVANLTNPTLGLRDLKPSSGDRCRWRCSECSHEWEATIASRVMRRSGCPPCGTRRASDIRTAAAAGESLLELYPDLASEFVSNETFPGRAPAQIRPRSNALCRWRCRRGHEWVTTVAARVAGTGCARCGARGQSRLELEVAELLRLSTGEHVEVDVRVRANTRTWRVDIHVASLELYIDLDPAHWHKDTNRDQRKVDALTELRYIRVRDAALPMLDRTPSITVERRSLDAAEWANALQPVVEALGGTWLQPTTESTAKSLAAAGDLWRKTLQGRPLRSAADVAPDLSRELLRNETRPGVDLDWVPPSARDMCWWKCRTCGHEWRSSIGARAYLGTGCPECSAIKAALSRSTAPAGGSLGDRHPEIAAEFEACSRPARSPADLRPSSNISCSWRCPECNLQYSASPASRVRGRGCPQCAQARAGDTRSRRDAARGKSLNEYPAHLAEEFIAIVGRPHRSPQDIPGGSNLKAAWRCKDCRNEWTSTVASRALGGTGCPACSHLRTANARSSPKPGHSLFDLAPTVASEFVDNLTHPGHSPGQLKAASHDRCRWRCHQGHEWETTVKNRVRGGTGCPVCRRIS